MRVSFLLAAAAPSRPGQAVGVSARGGLRTSVGGAIRRRILIRATQNAVCYGVEVNNASNDGTFQLATPF